MRNQSSDPNAQAGDKRFGTLYFSQTMEIFGKYRLQMPLGPKSLKIIEPGGSFRVAKATSSCISIVSTLHWKRTIRKLIRPSGL
mmetsp:Transcript_14790/g.34222  ORF Transcript_14790/g.34222 Transcript_14790/m.34222 type:complete len:84 (-) Transcript_14790:128-379(-)